MSRGTGAFGCVSIVVGVILVLVVDKVADDGFGVVIVDGAVAVDVVAATVNGEDANNNSEDDHDQRRDQIRQFRSVRVTATEPENNEESDNGDYNNGSNNRWKRSSKKN